MRVDLPATLYDWDAGIVGDGPNVGGSARATLGHPIRRGLLDMEKDVLDFGRSLRDTRRAFSAPELQLFSDLLGQVESLYGKRLQSVKLVGSRARGVAMDTSDFDFLVFLDSCDYEVEVPKLKDIGYQLGLKHGLGSISLSPLSREQFVGLDSKYEGITNNFRRDAVNLWPEPISGCITSRSCKR